MKKIIIMLISVLLTSTSLTVNASYNVVYGEKQINGDNIRFINKTETTPIEDCMAPNSEWIGGTMYYGLLRITWNSVVVIDTGLESGTNDYKLTEKIIGNYKYNRKNLVKDEGAYAIYNVCRIEI